MSCRNGIAENISLNSLTSLNQSPDPHGLLNPFGCICNLVYQVLVEAHWPWRARENFDPARPFLPSSTESHIKDLLQITPRLATAAERGYDVIDCETANEDLLASVKAHVQNMRDNTAGFRGSEDYRRLKWSDKCEELFHYGWTVSS